MPHVDVIRASDKSFNRHDVDGTARACAEDFTYTDRATSLTFRGVEEFKTYLKSWFDAFPDSAIDEGTYIDAGDAVVHQSCDRATNTGSLGDLPATGRSIAVPFCEVWRLNPDGKIVTGDLYYDQLSLMTQLGHVQPRRDG